MLAKRGRSVSSKLMAVMIVASVPLLNNCGKMPGGVPGASNLPNVPGSCPANIADASAIMGANFGLEGELEGKVKAALAASANLQAISAEVEGEVVTACSNLAKDLGAKDDDLKPKEDGPGKKAEAACNVASKLVGEFKAKAKGQVVVDVKPPKCEASMEASVDCAAKCDAKVKPGEVKATCEGGEISGQCDAKCEGKCTVDASANCEGSCSGECKGECSAEISGKCDGNCEGKCDGKDSKGKCAGTCDGKCKGKADAQCNGTCKGSCSASCEMQAKGECKGTCSGKCSVEMKAPKCSGTVKPPEVSAECKANCDAEVNGKAECKPATVFVKVNGAADAEAAMKLKAALTKNLPGLLKVSVGMKSKLEGAVDSVKVAVEGAQAAVTSGGDAALKVGSCFAASLEASARASVSINVSVKASASASGSASAG
ncbi:MAG: hypothetical protein K0R38_5768 [Polyangiaceae bacterium]|nr:hypothetical protein [Polyangiaceae bacterium]